jgi:chorismate mutase
VHELLTAVGAQASTRNIEPGCVTQAFTDQIGATTAIEYTRLADWTLDPASAPATAPDLDASRSVIDSLNSAMIDHTWRQLGCVAGTRLRSGIGCRDEIPVNRRQLDLLYERALRYAVHSYCTR